MQLLRQGRGLYVEPADEPGHDPALGGAADERYADVQVAGDRGAECAPSPAGGDRDLGLAVEPFRVLFGGERECARERLRVETELLYPRELPVADDPAGDGVDLADVLVAEQEHRSSCRRRARHHFGPAQVGKIELGVERRIAEHLGDRGAGAGKSCTTSKCTTPVWPTGGSLDTSARVLGASGLEVSRLALGSWRTFERLAATRAWRSCSRPATPGSRFSTTPATTTRPGRRRSPRATPRSCSASCSGAPGGTRRRRFVANKLWWEFWPDQSAAAELDASLARMQLRLRRRHLRQPAGARPDARGARRFRRRPDRVRARRVRGRSSTGPPTCSLEASTIATRQGLPQPCAAQLPYSLVHRSPVEDAVDARGARRVRCGSGGVVRSRRRRADRQVRPRPERRPRGRKPRASARRAGRGRGAELAELAGELDTTPSALAIVFTLANPVVASVLFGSTSPEQVQQNAAALEVAGRLDDAQLERLRAIR